MSRRSFAKVAWVAVALGVAVGVATAGAATETATAAVCGASACEVVLSCGGAIQKTVPNAEGWFTFRDVPAGTCTVSVAEMTPAATSGSPAVGTSSVAAPRDTATGMATGKRQHKPVAWQVTIDPQPIAVRTSSVDAASSTVSVVLQERRKELTGHVTLIK